MCADHESRSGTGNRAEKMCLPRNAGLTGKHAPNDRAIDQPYKNRRAKRHRRPVDKATRDEKAEPAEDQPGGADVNGRTPEKPDQYTPHADHDNVQGDKGSRYGCGEQRTEQKQGRCIRNQMPETAMQEWHTDDTVKPAELPRNEAKRSVERVAGRPVDRLNNPEGCHKSDQGRYPSQEHSHVTRSHHSPEHTHRQNVIKLLPRITARRSRWMLIVP